MRIGYAAGGRLVRAGPLSNSMFKAVPAGAAFFVSS